MSPGQFAHNTAQRVCLVHYARASPPMRRRSWNAGAWSDLDSCALIYLCNTYILTRLEYAVDSGRCHKHKLSQAHGCIGMYREIGTHSMLRRTGKQTAESRNLETNRQVDCRNVPLHSCKPGGNIGTIVSSAERANKQRTPET